jgi:hypothetical protein
LKQGLYHANESYAIRMIGTCIDVVLSCKSLLPLLGSRLLSVMRHAENLQVHIAVGAAVLKRRDVIDVCVSSLNDNAADATRVRITNENAQSSRRPIGGPVVRRLFERLYMQLRWLPSLYGVWHGVTF